MKGNQGQGSKGNTQHDTNAPTLGIGRRTSGEAGSTLTHETMAETGGSGGSGMTGDDAGAAPAPGHEAAEASKQQSNATRRNRGGDELADSGARGYQDTRGEQAGGTGTGLGTPETGSNQRPEDLEASVRRR